MMKLIRLPVFILLALVLLMQPARADTDGGDVDLHFFWSLHCPHCLEARPQIQSLAGQHPWIRLHEYEITGQPENLERFLNIAASLGREAQAVPTLFYCGQMQVGWDSSPSASTALLADLEACRSDGAISSEMPQSTRLHLPLLGETDLSAWSLPALTLILAGLDAFNPCAFFVLLFLLSLLVHQRQRSRMLLIGAVFVSISGLMYFAFMAAWLNIFLLMSSLTWVTLVAGVVAALIGMINIKDFFAFRQGISLSIPEARKTDIFQRARHILNAENLPAMLLATVALALAANFYELLCTAGFPMLFTRLLTMQLSNRFEQYVYLVFYNLIYVLPLLLIVLSFVKTMGARRLSEREGRLLKLLSGLMMFGLGLLLMIAPQKLDNVLVALSVPAAALLLTWLAARFSGGK